MLHRPTKIADRFWQTVRVVARIATRGDWARASQDHAFLENGNEFLMRDIGYVQQGERPDPWRLIRYGR